MKVNSREWILRENAVTAFNEVISRIYKTFESKNVVSYETVYEALKKELEIEISTREKDSKNKREFIDALGSIELFIDGKVNHFDFFFVIEGLKLENLEKISCGKVEIGSMSPLQ